jgi:hypothetical protein
MRFAGLLVILFLASMPLARASAAEDLITETYNHAITTLCDTDVPQCAGDTAARAWLVICQLTDEGPNGPHSVMAGVHNVLCGGT